MEGQTSTPGFGGMFSQSVPAMEQQDLISAGKPPSIVAVRDDSNFRTNLILCGTTEFVSVDAELTLVGPDGTVGGTNRYPLPPLGMTQVSRVVLALGGPANLSGVRLDLSTPIQDAAFAAYASVIDNVTNDPRTLLPRESVASTVCCLIEHCKVERALLRALDERPLGDGSRARPFRPRKTREVQRRRLS
jgi:hypothetical protein